MTQEQLAQIALDLLEFTENLPLSTKVREFWAAREYNISEDDKKKVLIVALTLSR